MKITPSRIAKIRTRDIEKWMSRGVCRETAVVMVDAGEDDSFFVVDGATGPTQQLLIEERSNPWTWL